MLLGLQNGLERLYRIDTELCVSDFLVDETGRKRLGTARSPREQLLLSEDSDGLSMGLFLDPALLASLDNTSLPGGVSNEQLESFLLALEGVSHFVYVAWRVRRDIAVSALELEVQAEVDKYITCLLMGIRESKALRRRLYVDIQFLPDLDPTESERYRIANRSAYQYTGWLQENFVDSNHITEMLGEVRKFYRLSLPEKIRRISELA